MFVDLSKLLKEKVFICLDFEKIKENPKNKEGNNKFDLHNFCLTNGFNFNYFHLELNEDHTSLNLYYSHTAYTKYGKKKFSDNIYEMLLQFINNN